MNQREVEIAGERYILSPRYAGDVIALGQAAENAQRDNLSHLNYSVAAVMISQALKVHYDGLRWWQWAEKRRYEKAMDTVWLLRNVSPLYMGRLIRILDELEETPVKKKASD